MEPKDNNKRRRLGLDPLCLKCDKPFKSEGLHNRLCPKCKEENRAILDEAGWLFAEILYLPGMDEEEWWR